MKDLLLFFILFFMLTAGALFTSRINTVFAHAKPVIDIPQTGWTEAVPAEYKTVASQQGSVVRLDYDSLDYAGNQAAITKTAYVYLPYGYDENDAETRYDVVYLMHGWGGHAGEYFEFSALKNVFDHLIENGDILPVIIVSPSFYNTNSDTGWGGSVNEVRNFHYDFENHLMVTVEGKYHTYAENTTPEGLMASRDHRMFGGFSLGAVTTWQIFCYDYDYVHYFLPMSGSSWYYGTYGDFQTVRNVDFIQQLIEEQNLNERGYFVYEAVGTEDVVKSQTLMQMEEMFSRGDVFPKEHIVFYQKEGGHHDFEAVQEFLYNGLPVILGAPESAEEQEGDVTVQAYYDTNSKITDVMADPAFGDYGRLLFPVNSGYYSGNTLGNLSMTWYNGIDPQKTVEIVNTLRSRALAKEQIFYSIYTDAEIAADPEKADTGLFFFKGDPSAKFAVCNAGGGFSYVGAMHDSFPHALELSKMGYNAFALIYRPGSLTACEDLARAIAFIYEHADELEVSTDNYSLWGGSAGARMAAWLGTYGTASFGEDPYPKAGAVIMQYTGLSEVTGNEPPTYNCVGTSDWIANYQTMENRIRRIKSNGTDAEIEIFNGLPHGFGLGTGTVAEGWINRAVAFWERQK